MPVISNREAVRRAIAEEMRRDEAVFLFGEDVAEPGGVFKVTQGLLEEFGPERVFDTPISESALAGVAVGAAMMGMRPILELMFADFTTIAMDGIVNSAAKTRFLTAGEVSAPLVIRMTYGAGPRWGAQHTQSVESWLANVPGLTIVMPSTPYDIVGLLKSAIRSPDPVIFLEHKQTYAQKGEVPDEEYLLPIGQADVKRPGDDVTIVASGAMVERALRAAETLAARGIGAEVVDIRTVVPLDVPTIVRSVMKTAHLVVVHEAPVFGGIGGEIAASVTQEAFGYLDAPVQRLGGAWAPIPFGQVLVDEYLPSESDLVAAARRSVGSASGSPGSRESGSAMDAVIGIDIGTYSSKGVVCRPDGSLLAEARVEHGVSIPAPGRLEHDADAVWWHDVVALSQQLIARLPPEVRVAAVGLSAIGPCLLPVDAADRPVRPAILYGADNRAAEQLTRLERGRRAAIVRLSGNDLTSQAAGPKIMWLMEHEPETMRRTSKLMTAAGYLVLKLTGEHTADHHNASYFAPFYDLRRARWDLRFADGAIEPELLPPLRWPSEIVGQVTPSAAAATGIPAGTPVLAGTTDGAAEAIGAGVIHPGDLMLSYGSTSALVLVLDRLQSAKPLWATRGSWPDEYVLTAALATSGSITTWCREQFARELPLDGPGGSGLPYEQLSREAEASGPGARGLLLLPYFSGERSPFNDPLARGVIAGLSLSHTRGDVYRAILEGTAFGIRHNLDALVEGGTVPRRTVAVGGGTASRLWLQIVSDVTGLVQEVPERAIGASFGDAYLAAVAAGLVERGQGVSSWVRIRGRVEPDPRRRERYEPAYALYRSLYRSTKQVVHALATGAASDGAAERPMAATPT